MTVTSQTTKATTAGNGSATTFSFSPIVIFASSELSVITTVVATGVETTRTEGTGASNWSLGITTFPATGSITYPADTVTPLTTAYTISIKRVLTLEQQTDLNNQGGYFPDVQETQFDKLVMIDLQQQESLNRSFAFPLSYTGGASTEVPAPTASTPLAWNAAGDALENSTASTLQPLDATLTALAAYNTNGLLTQTSSDTFTGRTITGTSNKITVSNGNGVSGNPTLTLPDAITLVTPTVSGLSIHGGDIRSDTDGTDSLGTTGVRWLKLWVDSITSTGAIAGTTINGTLGNFSTSLELASGATVTGIEDSDSLGSNSATLLATQQSIKAYVDSATAASAVWTDVVYLANSDSPYTIGTSLNGRLFAIDTSGGAVTINLPQISAVAAGFTNAIKKTTSDVNAVTVVRYSGDEIDEAASNFTITIKDSGRT